MKLRRILLQQNFSTSDLPLCYGGKEGFKGAQMRGHSAIAQSHFSLPQFERGSLWGRSTRLNGVFPNVVDARITLTRAPLLLLGYH